jgi:arsenate reductase (glutaredoxin)
LTEKGIEFESIEYQKTPFSADELERLLRSAGLKPQDALRKNEPAYQQYVAGQNLNDNQLLRTMAEHPELIQRPFVTRFGKAVLARPSSKLSELDIR